MSLRSISYFFFQAEDGIRDVAVTGVQTCALPIYGHYKFDHWRARLDFGVRYGDRKADNANFVLIAPVYGCDVRYKAVDVILDGGGMPGACMAGSAATGFYRAGALSALNPSQLPGLLGN